jgi:hypothetical protein
MNFKTAASSWILICFTFELCVVIAKPAAHEDQGIQNAIKHYKAIRVPLPILPLEGSVRAKREGFMDFEAIPFMMRDLAHNFGRGINNMMQNGQDLGHRLVN